MPCTSTNLTGRRIVLGGQVQGVGLRPAIARIAKTCGVAGSVANTLSGVELLVEGSHEQIEQFTERLARDLPESIRQSGLLIELSQPAGYSDFSIAPSPVISGEMATPVPRDVVMCADCRDEVASNVDRRSGYSFTSCTRCGPRFSIITAMPYERPRTGMGPFALCPECQHEFDQPENRRCHAETTSCSICGPRAWASDRQGRRLAVDQDAIALVVRCLREGQIVALRGIGGYQLLCAADNASVIARLRNKRRRPSKPFAIMVQSVGAAASWAVIDSTARKALTSDANPIVLMPARPDRRLPELVHPGVNTLGIMLPTSPLHWLILRDFGGPLIVTSGNIEGDPLETEPDAATTALRDIADIWLHHDRPIHHAIDDSVVRVMGNRAVTFRSGRGLAPLPLEGLRDSGKHLFATGGHQKTAFALSNGSQSILGPHVGDMEGIRIRERYARQAVDLQELYQSRPSLWIHDHHPDYFTTAWAERQPGTSLPVQHHHAHVVSGMLEHGWLDREVLGVAFDGTGYGPDDTVWGGEVLIASVQGYQRVGHLRPFDLPGGEVAVRQPWRVIAAMLHQIQDSIDPQRDLTPEEQSAMIQLKPLLQTRRCCVTTTSVGRLFDGVAALVMPCRLADYEGQPAQLLEAICELRESGEYSFIASNEVPLRLDWRPMLRELLADRRNGLSPGIMAMRFHRGLARAVTRICQHFDHLPPVFTGGVFQNGVLVELLADMLHGHPVSCGFPGLIPPNDGGLAAGQLAIGMALSRY